MDKVYKLDSMNVLQEYSSTEFQHISDNIDNDLIASPIKNPLTDKKFSNFDKSFENCDKSLLKIDIDTNTTCDKSDAINMINKNAGNNISTDEQLTIATEYDNLKIKYPFNNSNLNEKLMTCMPVHGYTNHELLSQDISKDNVFNNNKFDIDSYIGEIVDDLISASASDEKETMLKINDVINNVKTNMDNQLNIYIDSNDDNMENQIEKLDHNSELNIKKIENNSINNIENHNEKLNVIKMDINQKTAEYFMLNQVSSSENLLASEEKESQGIEVNYSQIKNNIELTNQNMNLTYGNNKNVNNDVATVLFNNNNNNKTVCDVDEYAIYNDVNIDVNDTIILNNNIVCGDNEYSDYNNVYQKKVVENTNINNKNDDSVKIDLFLLPIIDAVNKSEVIDKTIATGSNEEIYNNKKDYASNNNSFNNGFIDCITKYDKKEVDQLILSSVIEKLRNNEESLEKYDGASVSNHIYDANELLAGNICNNEKNNAALLAPVIEAYIDDSIENDVIYNHINDSNDINVENQIDENPLVVPVIDIKLCDTTCVENNDNALVYNHINDDNNSLDVNKYDNKNGVALLASIIEPVICYVDSVKNDINVSSCNHINDINESSAVNKYDMIEADIPILSLVNYNLLKDEDCVENDNKFVIDNRETNIYKSYDMYTVKGVSSFEKIKDEDFLPHLAENCNDYMTQPKINCISINLFNKTISNDNKAVFEDLKIDTIVCEECPIDNLSTVLAPKHSCDNEFLNKEDKEDVPPTNYTSFCADNSFLKDVVPVNETICDLINDREMVFKLSSIDNITPVKEYEVEYNNQEVVNSEILSTIYCSINNVENNTIDLVCKSVIRDTKLFSKEDDGNKYKAIVCSANDTIYNAEDLENKAFPNIFEKSTITDAKFGAKNDEEKSNINIVTKVSATVAIVSANSFEEKESEKIVSKSLIAETIVCSNKFEEKVDTNVLSDVTIADTIFCAEELREKVYTNDNDKILMEDTKFCIKEDDKKKFKIIFPEVANSTLSSMFCAKIFDHKATESEVYNAPINDSIFCVKDSVEKDSETTFSKIPIEVTMFCAKEFEENVHKDESSNSLINYNNICHDESKEIIPLLITNNNRCEDDYNKSILENDYDKSNVLRNSYIKLYEDSDVNAVTISTGECDYAYDVSILKLQKHDNNLVVLPNESKDMHITTSLNSHNDESIININDIKSNTNNISHDVNGFNDLHMITLLKSQNDILAINLCDENPCVINTLDNNHVMSSLKCQNELNNIRDLNNDFDNKDLDVNRLNDIHTISSLILEKDVKFITSNEQKYKDDDNDEAKVPENINLTNCDINIDESDVVIQPKPKIQKYSSSCFYPDNLTDKDCEKDVNATSSPYIYQFQQAFHETTFLSLSSMLIPRIETCTRPIRIGLSRKRKSDSNIILKKNH